MYRRLSANITQRTHFGMSGSPNEVSGKIGYYELSRAQPVTRQRGT